MTVRRMDDVGIVVDDLAAATHYRLCYVPGPEGIVVELAGKSANGSNP